MVIGVSFLANKQVPVERERPRDTVRKRYQPTVNLVDNGAAVGLSGSF